jgi:hypothetical protein
MMSVTQLLEAFGGIMPIDGDTFTPMSEGELEAIEKRLGVRLPESYRHFLTTYGATMPRKLVVYNPVERLPPEISETGQGCVAVFYGTSSDVDDAYSLQRRMQYFSGRIPTNMLPIADDGGGDQILLGISGKEAGKIYFWDLRNEPLDEEDYLEDYGKPRPPEAMFENVHLIADSFEDFLRRLEAKTD